MPVRSERLAWKDALVQNATTKLFGAPPDSTVIVKSVQVFNAGAAASVCYIGVGPDMASQKAVRRITIPAGDAAEWLTWFVVPADWIVYATHTGTAGNIQVSGATLDGVSPI